MSPITHTIVLLLQTINRSLIEYLFCGEAGRAYFYSNWETLFETHEEYPCLHIRELIKQKSKEE